MANRCKRCFLSFNEQIEMLRWYFLNHVKDADQLMHVGKGFSILT